MRGPQGREKGVFFEQERNRLPDPYIPKKGFPEPSLCPVCRAVYQHKHWSLEQELPMKAEEFKKINRHKCPACRKIEDRYPMGVVELTGGFVLQHKEEIINLVRAEETRAKQKNPLERLILVEETPIGLHIETTADSLALRIGRGVSKAYKGSTDFDFRYGDKFVMVKWHRD